MKKYLMMLAAFAVAGQSGVWAQQLDLTSLDRLASRSKESANVTLDESKLKLASMFLSAEDASQKQARDLVSGLKGIYVRTFEFDKPGEYTQAELEPIRRQLTTPGWSSIVNVKGRDESAEVWLHSKGQELAGLAIIAAESNELVVVNIVGPLDIASLASLSGSFGIPRLPDVMGGKKLAAPAKPVPAPAKPPKK